MKLLSENYIFYMRFRKGITYFFLIVLSIVTMLPLLFLLINAFKRQKLFVILLHCQRVLIYDT